MNQKDIKRSRLLSQVLRHKPEKIGIQLDSAGWVSVSELLEACHKHGIGLDIKSLTRIVETNDKQRFSFSTDGTKIRANQGHSVAVDLEYIPIQPPRVLYHGTAESFLPSIREKGLLKGERHHVHLSGDPKTARQVGKRHGKPVVLQVRSRKMVEDGYIFYQSANRVWLTDWVPPQYLVEKWW